jgi:Ca2+-transporting ATPase
MNAPLPLLPLQILYINIVSDVFPALALGVGGSRADVMKRPPRDPQEPILARRHWTAIGGYGAVIGLSVLAVFWLAFQLGMSTQEAVTVSFLTFGFARLWHVFNMRDADAPLIRNEVTTNRYVWIAIAIGIALLLGATYLPVLGDVLSLVAPSGTGWALIAAGSVVPLVIGQVVKVKALRRLLPGAD